MPPRKQGPLSVTTAIGAGTWPRTYSSGSTMSISPRSSRKSSRPVTRSASAIAACRQATASWGAAGRADGDGQAVFGGVVDHRADPPDPAGGGFELREVGLPDPVPGGRRGVEHLLAQQCP